MNFVQLSLYRESIKEQNRKAREKRKTPVKKNFPYSREREHKRLYNSLRGRLYIAEVTNLVGIPYLSILIRGGIIPRNKPTNAGRCMYDLNQVSCLIEAKQYASIRVLNNFTIDVKKFHEYIDKHWKWENEDAKQWSIRAGYKVYGKDDHCVSDDVGSNH